MRVATGAMIALLIGGCPSPDEKVDETAKAQLETLVPAPPGAPTEPADGRLTCLAAEAQTTTANALELTGYVRTLADPNAEQATPEAKVEVFDSAGLSLGASFSDPAKAGRVSVSVPVPKTGWAGYAEVSADGFMDYRFQTSNRVVDTAFSGWAWMTTQEGLGTRADAADVTLDATTGILYGAIHDCDGFGVANVLIQVSGSSDGVYFVEGFDVSTSRTWTSETGRFVVPNLAPGSVVVKAFGRLEADGPLTLLAKAEPTMVAGQITALNLDPAQAAK